MTCPNCGNSIPNTYKCPHCQQWLGLDTPLVDPGRQMVTLNLEQGSPTGDEAMRRFDDALERALHAGTRVLKVIHGYGSSGVGGVIRDRVRKACGEKEKEGTVAYWVKGEDCRVGAAGRKRLAKQFPKLLRDGSFRTGNQGLTWVELRKGTG